MNIINIIEDIGDSEIVFRRAHINLISKTNQTPTPNLFDFNKEKDKKTWIADISVNWKKYCQTPKEAQSKAKKKPELYGILSLVVKDIRENCESFVNHSPSGKWFFLKDKSHSSIIPIKGVDYIKSEKQRDLIYRQELAKVAKWEIKP